MIVLDNSGSMNEYFQNYYYDSSGKRIDLSREEGIMRQLKIECAKESVLTILDHLQGDDRFSIVIFNVQAILVKPMSLVRKTDMSDIEDRVMSIKAGGSTNFSAGIEMATAQFRNLYEIDNYEYENRIIFLTDAMPNTGEVSGEGFMRLVENNASSRIYTTVIGIGVDFNTELIERITKAKGANYYSVHSPRDFRERMADEFDYMVTPLVFDLELSFQSRGWKIEKVFGSPEADEASGKLMRINTLFPSKKEAGQTKGGLVLLKLRKTSASSRENIYLRTTYEDRDGRRDGSESVITLDRENPEFFENTGIRKGILLARYAALLKNWMNDERQYAHYSSPWKPAVDEDEGIIIPPESSLSRWERTSLPLTVSPQYKKIFQNFGKYFEKEIYAINDDSLNQELDILNYLSRYR